MTGFAFEHKIKYTALNLDLGNQVIINFYRRLREIICIETDIENIKLGGIGKI